MNKHQVSTAMRTAFENIKVQMPRSKSEKLFGLPVDMEKNKGYIDGMARIGGMVMDAINGKAGIYKRNDWNAHLSFRTAGLLNAPAFNTDRHFGKNNAFDCMVG